MLERLGVEFRFDTEIGSPFVRSKPADALVLAVGLGEDADVRYPATSSRASGRRSRSSRSESGRQPAVGVASS